MESVKWWRLLPLLVVAPALAPAQVAPGPAAAPTPVVRAVLFYSPTCPHCHKVMTEDLPPLIQRYGPQLRIATVNVATPGGQALYQATIERLSVPDSRLGVPTLVVGSRVLVGSEEIPAELPGIVDRGLAGGGIGWPDVPEIRAAIARTEAAEPRQQPATDSVRAAAQAPAPSAPVVPPAETAAAGPRDTAAGREIRREPAAAPGLPPATAPAQPSRSVSPLATRLPAAPESPAADTATGANRGAVTEAQPVEEPFNLTDASAPSAWARFRADPVGNGASVVVLVAMLLALGLVAAAVLGRRVRLPEVPGWVVPALGLAGLAVAAYLAVVEVTGARAVCGPVGDCNTVQQSAYARLFDVLPIGVLGMVGYVGMVAAWLLGARGRGLAARVGRLGAWGLALFGALFSVYLTFLEPFVIGATCAWCLTSAVIVTLLLLVLTPAARGELRGMPATGTLAAT